MSMCGGLVPFPKVAMTTAKASKRQASLVMGSLFRMYSPIWPIVCRVKSKRKNIGFLYVLVIFQLLTCTTPLS